MQPTSTEAPARLVRFGNFEVDLESGELRRKGLKVRLQEQPRRILEVLLEQPGEVVTREELRRKLWQPDTFVDFDHSLNTAMMRLREILGDSPDHPRFIETVPRRGYRFIFAVQQISREHAPQRMLRAWITRSPMSWLLTAQPSLRYRLRQSHC